MRSLFCSVALAWPLLAVGCGGCGGESARAPARGGGAGARHFEVQGCITCHGAQGDGTILGPTLRGSAKHWTRATLADYLADPEVWVEKTPRLSATQRNFPAKMQPFRNLSENERLELADFVLALP